VSDLHKPVRPSWHCSDDNEPWPCALVRKQLGETFLDSEDVLAVHMAWLMAAAARDLGLADPSKLYRRFVRWTAGDRAVCGRCGHTGHQALPGLPPRLFPCEFRRGGHP
jgi:hypothetical protein